VITSAKLEPESPGAAGRFRGVEMKEAYRSTRRAMLVAIGAALATVASPSLAHACACCSEDGERQEGTFQLEAYDLDELAKVRFGKVAKVYLNAAGFDAVQGITKPTDKYQTTHTIKGTTWTFTFRDATAGTGTLTFTLPAKAERFFVDLQDGKQGGAGGPLLYKEWRLTAPVTATGIFAPSMSGKPTARLVLQGRGNSCTSADQFTHWTLQVSGPKARYTLFGQLVPIKP